MPELALASPVDQSKAKLAALAVSGFTFSN
jgi:hypothetical protein